MIIEFFCYLLFFDTVQKVPACAYTSLASKRLSCRYTFVFFLQFPHMLASWLTQYLCVLGSGHLRVVKGENQSDGRWIQVSVGLSLLTFIGVVVSIFMTAFQDFECKPATIENPLHSSPFGDSAVNKQPLGPFEPVIPGMHHVLCSLGHCVMFCLFEHYGIFYGFFMTKERDLALLHQVSWPARQGLDSY